MKKITREEALAYHTGRRHGKTEVVPTKPCVTQRDLSLAYTPGVAEPCLDIAKDPELAYEYTNKGNLVAVVSNGTAVLGLGNIGALAGKPVMEGKGVLFKRFADIDVFDIEIDTTDPKEVIRFCEMLAPTIGGINLEDIKAPECFVIEEALGESQGGFSPGPARGQPDLSAEDVHQAKGAQGGVGEVVDLHSLSPEFVGDFAKEQALSAAGSGEQHRDALEFDGEEETLLGLLETPVPEERALGRAPSEGRTGQAEVGEQGVHRFSFPPRQWARTRVFMACR